MGAKEGGREWGGVGVRWWSPGGLRVGKGNEAGKKGKRRDRSGSKEEEGWGGGGEGGEEGLRGRGQVGGGGEEGNGEENIRGREGRSRGHVYSLVCLGGHISLHPPSSRSPLPAASTSPVALFHISPLCCPLPRPPAPLPPPASRHCRFPAHFLYPAPRPPPGIIFSLSSLSLAEPSSLRACCLQV